MDPDATLRSVIDLLGTAQERDLTAAEGNELAELVTALDGWLSDGGFLPKEWQR